MLRKKIFIHALILCSLMASPAGTAKATTEGECAIWLCLPAGFPPGCETAYQAFFNRIKKGRAPLPDLLSCTSGPHGEQISGNYSLGQEIFEPCQSGYVLKVQDANSSLQTKCELAQCSQNLNWAGSYNYCPNYDAVRRAKPNYVKMWVGSDYLGQFWY